MKFHGRFALLVMLMMAAGVAWAQNSPASGSAAGTSAAGGRLLTVDDYFRIKGVEDPQISPDGKWVAYTVETANLKEDKNEKQIWMIPTAGGTPIAMTGATGRSSHPRWSPDGKFIAFISARQESGEDEEKGTKQVWLLNREGGRGAETDRHGAGRGKFRVVASERPAGAGAAGSDAGGN